MKVLYIGDYDSSTKLFLELLKMGKEYEWGTVQTAEEAKTLIDKYDAVTCGDGVEFHCKKLITKQNLTKGVF
ncbi:MAG: hypothetical protein M0P71_00765 [Melioribacteraceae bacterium]|nr:hypothetical protein [Melioribacteraceae bacterium]